MVIDKIPSGLSKERFPFTMVIADMGVDEDGAPVHAGEARLGQPRKDREAVQWVNQNAQVVVRGRPGHHVASPDRCNQ
jgi:hypothetical protein